MRTNDKQDIYEKLSLLVNTFVDTHELSNEAFLKRALDSAFELIPDAEKGSIYINQNGIYRPVCAKGYDLTILDRLSFTDTDLFIGFEYHDIDHIKAYQNYILKRDDSKFSEEILDTFKALGTYENFTSLYAPLVYDRQIIGLISLEKFVNTPYSKLCQDVLKFYAQSISNHYALKLRYDHEKRLYDQTIMSLVTAIEVKDPYTEGHARRVMLYSEWIGAALQLPSRELEKLKIAALLHDVGKIGISNDLLNKPGKLTAEEFDQIKKHPENAKKILTNLSDFNDIVMMTYMHHEHFDGSGYPQGLKGDEITYGAHIIQVADAYDAMTSDRSYRKAMTHEAAIQVLLEASGNQFHPDVVAAAVAILNLIKQTH